MCRICMARMRSSRLVDDAPDDRSLLAAATEGGRAGAAGGGASQRDAAGRVATGTMQDSWEGDPLVRVHAHHGKIPK